MREVTVKVNETARALSKAKKIALRRMPYLASLLFSARTIEKPEIGTMAVDRHGRLYIAPEFVKSLTPDECAFVLLHEMLHIALSHPKRAQRFIPAGSEPHRKAWNIAADISVNEILQRDAGDICPSTAVRLRDFRRKDPRFRSGMSTEQYYALLIDASKDDPSCQQQGQSEQGEGGQDEEQQGPATGGSCADGVSREYEESVGMSEALGSEGKLIEVESAIEQHEREGKGGVPGELKQAIKVRLHPTPDPFEQLRSAVSRSVASPLGNPVSTFRKLNRRQQQDMPRRRGEIRYAPECVVIVDTSGSMECNSNKELALNAVAKGLRRVHRPRVICADGKIQSVKHISSMKSFEWCGGGCTHMDAAIEYADSEFRPDAIVLITDGYTNYPAKRTRARLIVGLVSDGDAYYSVPCWAKSIHCNKKGSEYSA